MNLSTGSHFSNRVLILSIKFCPIPFAVIFDSSDNKIEVDQDNVDAARVELDKTKYKLQRTGESGTTDTIYASVHDQLDMQYWDSVNGTTTWKDHIAAVKAKYPKPS